MCYNAAVEEASVSENCCIGMRMAYALAVEFSGENLTGAWSLVQYQVIRRRYNIMNEILKSIADNWKLDAKLEKKDRYFFYIEEYDKIVNGNKCYVIGRKGSGKSAICEKIISSNNDIFHATKLSFKNYPFNELYGLNNSKYTPPNQYITLWKYIIYSSVCKLLCDSKLIDKKIKGELLKLYPKNNTSQPLARTITQWTSAEFGIEFFGSGGKITFNRDISDSKLSWLEKVNLLEDILLKYCDTSSYMIVFDELDEDYRSFINNTEATAYINLLTSLFKAVQDIQAVFENTDKKIKPIVFLRDDIYSLIKDSDKNKWRDYKIEIEWNTEKIKNMLAHRILCDANIKEYSCFDDAWAMIVSNDFITYGTNNKNRCSIFDYITKSTLLRPRDYIRYIQACAIDALDRNLDLIRYHTVKYVDRDFSNYLKDEITDELFPIIPEIEVIYQIISNQRKWNIRTDDFVAEYNKYVTTGSLTERNVDKVLDTLFNFSVIGNQHPKKTNVQYFKYIQTNMKFNRNENIVIHRGLFKSLGII